MALPPWRFSVVLRIATRVAGFAALGAVGGTVLWIGIGYFIGLIVGHAAAGCIETAWMGLLPGCVDWNTC